MINMGSIKRASKCFCETYYNKDVKVNIGISAC